jgi:hypothetical protein
MPWSLIPSLIPNAPPAGIRLTWGAPALRGPGDRERGDRKSPCSRPCGAADGPGRQRGASRADAAAGPSEQRRGHDPEDSLRRPELDGGEGGARCLRRTPAGHRLEHRERRDPGLSSAGGGVRGAPAAGRRPREGPPGHDRSQAPAGRAAGGAHRAGPHPKRALRRQRRERRLDRARDHRDERKLDPLPGALPVPGQPDAIRPGA